MTIYNLVCPFGDYIVIITQENKYIIRYYPEVLYWYDVTTRNTRKNTADPVETIIKVLEDQHKDNKIYTGWYNYVFNTQEEFYWVIEVVKGLTHHADI